MLGKLFAHLRCQWMGALALFLVLTGGTGRREPPMLKRASPGRKTRLWRLVGALAVGLTMALGAGACGGGDDEETTEASAGRVTVTTTDAADRGYTWEVSPTPTAETTLVVFQNESKEPHELIFARLGEGYTVDEAYELQGKKGSVTEMMRSIPAAPGNRDAGGQQAGSPTGEIADVTKPLTPGDYVMLCPLAGKDGPHYKLGQLEEFAVE